ncbi:MAG: hypothetical protein CVU42_03060 [Chloroflexi bacterium HGW-Chloroflexi-4]|jgi:PAS domain S-box-containing protein|nr:MAG: hypothetical protein CVU42_03060 [Chloroflexi bacterium HGW-Chloroflexi-4]
MLKRIFLSLQRNWFLFIVVTFFISSIVIFEVIINTTRKQRAIAEVSSQLTTMANLKSLQIHNWRSERLIDGQTYQTDYLVSEDIYLLFQDLTDYLATKKSMDRMRSLLKDPNYSSIFLLDDKGNEIYHVGYFYDTLRENIFDQIYSISLTREIEITSLYRDANGKVKMDMVAPVFLRGDHFQPILAYLVYIITPDEILYPLLQSQPTSFSTAETLLVHRKNDEVEYLNELRFIDNSALDLTIPITESQTLAVMAVNGVTGTVTGVDYRGIPVMASIVSVEGTDWKIIAKIDLEEINKPIRQQLISTLMTAVLLIAAGLISVSVLWRKQSASVTKGLSDSEKLRKNLEEKYSTLFNQANDAILLVEENGRILEANAQAVQMYGYSEEELIKLSVSELRDDSVKHTVPLDMEQVKNGSANIFQTTHKKKNGELFQVGVSSRYLSIDGKGVFQSLIRDITKTKQAEEELRLSELALKKAQAVSHVGSWVWYLKENTVEWSDEMFAIYGLDKQNFNADISEIIKTTTYGDDLERITRLNHEGINSKTLFSYEYRIIRPDGSIRDIWAEVGEYSVDEHGEVVSLSGITQDITDKKAAEKEIRKSENLLQRIYDLLPVGLWLTDENGKLIRSNKMVKEIWGRDILVGIEEFQVFRGRRLPSREEIIADDWASVHTVREGVTIRDEMIEIDAYDGKTKTILNYSTPILDEDGKLEGAIVLNLDISELKKAEEQLSAQLDELRRWNLATLGRETRIRELKMEINKLLIECGNPPKYQSVMDDEHD